MTARTTMLAGALLIAACSAEAAFAQAAPGLSNATRITGQTLAASRAEAQGLAANAEQRALALSRQRAQLSLLEAQALDAARPKMRLDTGGPTPVSFSMPTGSGLVPGANGDANYHVNIQVGEGNSSSITTSSVQSDETFPAGETTQSDPDETFEE